MSEQKFEKLGIYMCNLYRLMFSLQSQLQVTFISRTVVFLINIAYCYRWIWHERVYVGV